MAVLEPAIGFELITECFVEGDRPVAVAHPNADVIHFDKIQHGMLRFVFDIWNAIYIGLTDFNLPFFHQINSI